MKNIFESLAGFTAVVISIAVSLTINGCTKVNAPSLYDPNFKSLPQPVVDSLSPAGSALAGVDTITIYGKYFSANRDSDGIYFNSTLLYNTSIISASQSQLVVKAPALSGDSIQVRVYVIGAVDFSSTVTYELIAAISPFSTLASGEAAYGLCTGTDANLYASLSNANLSGTKDEGIFKIDTTTGSRTSYASPTSGNVDWGAIKFGPGGYIYAVKGNRAVYRIPQGGSGAIWASASSGTFSDLDFDQNGNLWVAGTNNIYRIAQDATIKTFPFAGAIHAVRYFNGNLYFAANVGSSPSQVFRSPLVNDSLGTPEAYFNLSSDPTGGNTIWAITFSADGDMYAGTDSSDYLIVIHPSGIAERPYSLYAASGVLNSPCRAFAWIGTNLYTSTTAGGLLKITARKQGAPYYGIQ
ncbi:MAG: IPT/TIG domain-containing protein [Candidatus Kryptoniota bacterium]